MKDSLIKVIDNIHREHDGAFYLFNIEKLYSWYDMLDERLGSALEGKGSLVYAIKANPFLTKYMNEKVDSFEVCSPGEFEICMKYGIPTEKIVFSGVYKSKENIERIFECDFKGIVTLESYNHYKLLKEVMDEKSLSGVRILPRLSSGNKFGMDEDTIINIVKDAISDNRISVAGIQYFSGTQKKKIKVIREELEAIDKFIEKLKLKTGLGVDFVEYGPGFFYDYYSLADHVAVFDEVLDEIKPYINKYSFALESGRFLAAGCGEYVTEIVDVKSTFDKKYCLVDGGIQHVNYYGRMLGMNVPSVDQIKCEDDNTYLANKGTGDLYEVGGALCTVSDVLLKNYELDEPKCGDLLVFHDTGAYSCTESSVLFLSRTLPRIFAFLPSGAVEMLRDTIESYELNS